MCWKFWELFTQWNVPICCTCARTVWFALSVCMIAVKWQSAVITCIVLMGLYGVWLDAKWLPFSTYRLTFGTHMLTCSNPFTTHFIISRCLSDECLTMLNGNYTCTFWSYLCFPGKMTMAITINACTNYLRAQNSAIPVSVGKASCSLTLSPKANTYLIINY